ETSRPFPCARKPRCVPALLVLSPVLHRFLVLAEVFIAGGQNDERMYGQTHAPAERRQVPEPPRREGKQGETEDQERPVDDCVHSCVTIETQSSLPDPGVPLLEVPGVRHPQGTLLDS